MPELTILEVLTRVREDINWMLNNHQFLNDATFSYLDEAIEKAESDA